MTDTPEALVFAARRAGDAARVNVRHMAALTKGFEGREMTEIGFLLDAGAVAFSDADAPVQNPKGSVPRHDLRGRAGRADHRATRRSQRSRRARA